MKPLRIFVSSPGDVGEERMLAQKVIERLQAEFAGVLGIEPIFWEHEPLRATATFQSQLCRPSEADIVVCILWSRLGTRLPSQFQRADGSHYASGTEFEFEDAYNSYRERTVPDLLVYRKTETPSTLLDSEEKVLQKLAQKRALDAFINKWFQGTDGSFTAAFHAFKGPPEFEDALEGHLRKLIEIRLLHQPPSVEAKPTPTPWRKGSPFRGLHVFDFEHAPIFFGRTQAVSEVLNLLRQQIKNQSAFILVLGMSGCGKSSLLRAGVLPSLCRPGVIEGIAVVRWTIFRPSDASEDLFTALARALMKPEALPELGKLGTSLSELAVLLAKTPQAALPLIKAALNQAAIDIQLKEGLSDKPETRLTIIIDQLEEMFTWGRITPEERKTFSRLLVSLSKSGHVWVLATLRSDFYSRCLEMEDLMRLKEGGQYDLRPPNPAEISQMIRLPARVAGLTFGEHPQTGEQLDDVLRDAAIRHPELLPLLQFTLDELYKNRTPNGVLPFEAYSKLGGVEGTLAKRAEEVFLSLQPAEQSVFPSIFSALISLGLGDNNAATRRRTDLERITNTPEKKAGVDAFVREHLFIVDRTDEGGSVCSLVHEAIIQHWPRLVDWLRDNEDFLRNRARLGTEEVLWREHNQSGASLLSGQRLREASKLLKQRPEDFSERIILFIHESAKAASEQQKRRTVVVVASALVAALAYVAASDSGLPVLGRERIQGLLDHSQITLFRPVQTDARNRQAAGQARHDLFKVLRELQLKHGWVPYHLRESHKQKMLDAWSNGQGLTAMFKTPEARPEELRDCLKSLEASFAPELLIEKDGKNYGWVKEFGAPYQYTLAPPALWTAVALGAALNRPGLLTGTNRQQYEQRLFYTQQILKTYRPLETGGWNLFPNQVDPSDDDPYITALAFLALLEVRAAGSPWEGSIERRDTLLRNTGQWLVNHYTNSTDEIGWTGAGESAGDIKDGLTLQIYAELLRAEAEAGFNIPPNIVRRIPQHLIECTGRTMLHHKDSAESSVSFTNHLGQLSSQNESVEFPWHPWAINCAVLWLQRTRHHPAPPEDIFRVRRMLGHLLVDLREDAVAKALASWTFVASETLYGLSAVPPQE